MSTERPAQRSYETRSCPASGSTKSGAPTSARTRSPTTRSPRPTPPCTRLTGLRLRDRGRLGVRVCVGRAHRAPGRCTAGPGRENRLGPAGDRWRAPVPQSPPPEPTGSGAPRGEPPSGPVQAAVQDRPVAAAEHTHRHRRIGDGPLRVPGQTGRPACCWPPRAAWRPAPRSRRHDVHTGGAADQEHTRPRRVQPLAELVVADWGRYRPTQPGRETTGTPTARRRTRSRRWPTRRHTPGHRTPGSSPTPGHHPTPAHTGHHPHCRTGAEQHHVLGGDQRRRRHLQDRRADVAVQVGGVERRHRPRRRLDRPMSARLRSRAMPTACARLIGGSPNSSTKLVTSLQRPYAAPPTYPRQPRRTGCWPRTPPRPPHRRAGSLGASTPSHPSRAVRYRAKLATSPAREPPGCPTRPGKPKSVATVILARSLDVAAVVDATVPHRRRRRPQIHLRHQQRRVTPGPRPFRRSISPWICRARCRGLDQLPGILTDTPQLPPGRRIQQQQLSPVSRVHRRGQRRPVLGRVQHPRPTQLILGPGVDLVGACADLLNTEVCGRHRGSFEAAPPRGADASSRPTSTRYDQPLSPRRPHVPRASSPGRVVGSAEGLHASPGQRSLPVSAR